MKLYEITEDFRILNQWLDEAEGEITPELDALLKDSQVELERKMQSIAYAERNMSGFIAALKNEIALLKAKKECLEGKVQSLKDYAAYNLRAMGLCKAKAGIFTVSIQQNPPSVLITDMDGLPDTYKIAHIQMEASQLPQSLREQADFTPNKIRIGRDLKEGIEIPGAKLVRGESIQIR